MKYIFRILVYVFVISVTITACEKDELKNSELDLYYIDEDFLAQYGWEGGIASSDICMIWNLDSLKHKCIYVDDLSNDKSGIPLFLDENNQVYMAEIDGTIYHIYEEAGSLFMAELDENGNAVNIVEQSKNTTTKSMTDIELKKLEILMDRLDIIADIFAIQDRAQNVIDKGLWGAICAELSAADVLKMKLHLKHIKDNKELEDKLKAKIAKINFFENLQGVINGFLDKLNNNSVFGNINLEIIGIERDVKSSRNLIVTLKITNVDSPAYFLKDYKMNVFRNNLYYSVVAGENSYLGGFATVDPSIYKYTTISGQILLSRAQNEQIVKCYVSGLPETVRKVKLRPALVSDKEFDQSIFTKGNFVTYGDVVEYEFNDSAVSPSTAETLYSLYRNGILELRGCIDTYVYCKDGTRWGLYYYDDGGNIILSETYNKNISSAIIDFKVNKMSPKVKFTSKYGNATYDVGLGVYHLDTDGNIESFGELKMCSFRIKGYPQVQFNYVEILGTDRPEEDELVQTRAANDGYITYFSQEFTITGAFFINKIYYISDNPEVMFYIQNDNVDFNNDGTFSDYGYIAYGKDLGNINTSAYYMIELTNGEVIPYGYSLSNYHNRVIWYGYNEITGVELD